jgi:hypothetical protein
VGAGHQVSLRRIDLGDEGGGRTLSRFVIDNLDLDRAVILASTHVHLRGRGDGQAGAAAWLGPNGAHVFDAGTFDWSWGLDPRYASALSGFPSAAFEELTAEILAWAGVLPTIR